MESGYRVHVVEIDSVLLLLIGDGKSTRQVEITKCQNNSKMHPLARKRQVSIQKSGLTPHWRATRRTSATAGSTPAALRGRRFAGGATRRNLCCGKRYAAGASPIAGVACVARRSSRARTTRRTK